jgi:2-keto-4-pentenoate hydratase
MSAAARDMAARLAAARGAARILDVASQDVVANVDAAYAVQAELIRLAGGAVRGWKVTALLEKDQKKYAATRPLAGPLLAPFVHDAPASLRLSSYVTPLLECEVAFLLAKDLPAHIVYDRAAIEAAIAAVIPVFELADSRLPADAPDLMKLADAMGNGAFVVGQPVADWRRLDLGGIDIALTRDGVDIEHGSSARIPGNPLHALIALANAQPLSAELKAGQIVTTGTCTTPLAVEHGRYAADFGPLGKIAMTLA